MNKVKQDLAAENEQRQIQEMERQQRNETFSAAIIESEKSDNLKVRSNCNTVKM